MFFCMFSCISLPNSIIIGSIGNFHIEEHCAVVMLKKQLNIC